MLNGKAFFNNAGANVNMNNRALSITDLVFESLNCVSKKKRKKPKQESAYSYHDDLRIHRNSSGRAGGVYHLIGNTIKSGAHAVAKVTPKKKKSWLGRLFKSKK